MQKKLHSKIFASALFSTSTVLMSSGGDNDAGGNDDTGIIEKATGTLIEVEG